MLFLLGISHFLVSSEGSVAACFIVDFGVSCGAGFSRASATQAVESPGPLVLGN